MAEIAARITPGHKSSTLDAGLIRMVTMSSPKWLTILNQEVIACTLCPRLVAYRETIARELRKMADEMDLHLVLTTGGTGMSMRDITPEATKDVIDRDMPGIPEAMRAKRMLITPRGMLSRAVAGIRKQTLIINLPGSPKAVAECLDVILPVLEHGIQILRGETGECARK